MSVCLCMCASDLCKIFFLGKNETGGSWCHQKESDDVYDVRGSRRGQETDRYECDVVVE